MDFGSLFGLDLIEWLRRMHCLLGTDHHQTNKDNFLAVISEHFGFLVLRFLGFSLISLRT